MRAPLLFALGVGLLAMTSWAKLASLPNKSIAVIANNFAMLMYTSFLLSSM